MLRPTGLRRVGHDLESKEQQKSVMLTGASQASGQKSNCSQPTHTRTDKGDRAGRKLSTQLMKTKKRTDVKIKATKETASIASPHRAGIIQLHGGT